MGRNHSGFARGGGEGFQQKLRARGALRRNDRGQRLAPLAGFFRVGVADLVGGHDFGDSFLLFLYGGGIMP